MCRSCQSAKVCRCPCGETVPPKGRMTGSARRPRYRLCAGPGIYSCGHYIVEMTGA